MKRIALVGMFVFLMGLWMMVIAGAIDSFCGVVVGGSIMAGGCLLMAVELFAASANKGIDRPKQMV